MNALPAALSAGEGGALPFDAGADFAPLAAEMATGRGGGLEVTAVGGGFAAAAFPKGVIAFGGGLAVGLPAALLVGLCPLGFCSKALPLAPL